MTETEFFASKVYKAILNWAKEWQYEPLQITFYLAAPIALSHPWIHFDGIIAHLILRRFLGQDYYLLPSKFPLERAIGDFKDNVMPILFLGEIPMASVSIFENQKPKSEVIYKKLETNWIGKIRKLYHGVGYFKEYAMRHVYISTSKVDFYAVGDSIAISDLLSELVSLGEHTRLGWGLVKNIEIQKISEDRSLVYQGIAQRPIPVRFCQAYSDKFLLAWKPPYWSSDSVELCVPPGAKVELKPEIQQLMRIYGTKMA